MILTEMTKRLLVALLLMTSGVEAQQGLPRQPDFKRAEMWWYSDIEKIPHDTRELRVMLRPESIDSCYKNGVDFSKFSEVRTLNYSPVFYQSSFQETDSLTESYLLEKMSEMKKIHTLNISVARRYDLLKFDSVSSLRLSSPTNNSALSNRSILGLRQLKYLTISDTPVENLTENSPIFHLKHLKFLTIDYSPYFTFTDFPFEYIGKIDSLMVLKIDGRSALKKIPDTWQNLKNLYAIEITADQLDSIPSFLCTGLEHIFLSTDVIPVFPECIFDLERTLIHVIADPEDEFHKSRLKQLKKQLRHKKEVSYRSNKLNIGDKKRLEIIVRKMY